MPEENRVRPKFRKPQPWANDGKVWVHFLVEHDLDAGHMMPGDRARMFADTARDFAFAGIVVIA